MSCWKAVLCRIRSRSRQINGRAARLGLLATVATVAIAGAGAQAASAYENPFAGDQPYVGRTDMGVDVCLSTGDPIHAVGNGVVVGIMRNWFENEPYIWYRLTGGPDAGRYVYVAEQINHLAAIGTTLHAGDVVARYAAKGTCIETGWSAADGATLAQVTTGYTEGQVTEAGVSFARLLISVGVQGEFELVPTKPRTAAAKASQAKKKKKKKAKKPAAHPAPAPAAGSSSAGTASSPVPSPPVSGAPGGDGSGGGSGYGDGSGYNGGGDGGYGPGGWYSNPPSDPGGDGSGGWNN